MGPSHLDVEQYHHILTSGKYKKENKELRVQLATLATAIATKILEPKTLEALAGCRLITLVQSPRVFPIGIGEVIKRIIWKSISGVPTQSYSTSF